MFLACPKLLASVNSTVFFKKFYERGYHAIEIFERRVKKHKRKKFPLNLLSSLLAKEDPEFALIPLPVGNYEPVQYREEYSTHRREVITPTVSNAYHVMPSTNFNRIPFRQNSFNPFMCTDLEKSCVDLAIQSKWIVLGQTLLEKKRWPHQISNCVSYMNPQFYKKHYKVLLPIHTITSFFFFGLFYLTSFW